MIRPKADRSVVIPIAKDENVNIIANTGNPIALILVIRALGLFTMRNKLIHPIINATIPTLVRERHTHMLPIIAKDMKINFLYCKYKPNNNIVKNEETTEKSIEETYTDITLSLLPSIYAALFLSIRFAPYSSNIFSYCHKDERLPENEIS